MIIRPFLFRRVTIVGVGLMGGSLGLALKKYKLAKEIVGLSQKQSSLVEAIKAGAIDTAENDIPKAIKHSDLIILATPVDSILKLLPTISPHVRRGSIITDLGSTKLEIVERAQKTLNHPMFFVGSHPLVGSEKIGIQFARADLFEGATCIMTPGPNTHNGAREKVNQLWSKIGAKVKMLTPEEHDEILTFISHLPHLSAYALMSSIPQKHLEYATQGLKDTTRIASSSVQVWNDIMLSNAMNIAKSIDEYVRQLSNLRSALINRDSKELMRLLTAAKEKRDGII